MAWPHDTTQLVTLPSLSSPEALGPRVAAPDPTLVDGEEEYEVEEILKYRYYRRQHQFLVAWRGYGREADEWVSQSKLDNCAGMVTTFKQQHGLIF